MSSRSNVLPRKQRPTTKSYRTAIKQIVLDVQADSGLTDGDLAERLGCSVSTIRNARNEACNLDGVTLANIEFEFGPSAIDPFLALGGSRGVPEGATCNTDINHALPLAEALTKIIGTQHSSSPGGVATLGEEAAPILQSLREARSALDSLIALGEGYRMKLAEEAA